MEHRTLIGSVLLSWLGSITTAIKGIESFLGIAALALSIGASVYAIRVAMRTLTVKGLETVEHQQVICLACLSGNPPAVCPFPPGQRPKTCKRTP